MENSQNSSSFSASGIALVISVIVSLQALFALGLALWLTFEALSHPEGSLTAVLFELVMLVGFAFWAFFAGASVRKFAGWARASIICIEILWMAVGFGFNQGDWANPLLAIALVIPAALVLLLMFLAPMREAFARTH
ncbi:MAG: hypothetical protein KF916_05445 [Microbacteriaceae bacterium]|nr:hypothetical protein [Microbacteriaceae bacterium]